MFNFENSRKRNKKTIYQKISKMIQNNATPKENYNVLKNELKGNIKNLKRLDLIDTRYKIELEKYDTGLYFLDHDILVMSNKYCYYAKLIGYVDGCIAFFNERLKFEKERNVLENIKSLKNILAKLNDKRKILINELENSYKETVKEQLEKTSFITEKEIFVDILKHYPSYEKFKDLYKNDAYINNNIYTLFIDSYNLGYSNVYSMPIDETFNFHNKLQRELKLEKKKNIAKYSNTVVKVRANRFH